MHYTQHCTSTFQSLQSTESRRPHTSRTLCRITALVRPEPPPLCDGTSPLHSNTHSNTIAHSFQLVFQLRVHFAQFASMRTLQAQNCADVFESQHTNCTAPTMHKHELIHNPSNNVHDRSSFHWSVSFPLRQTSPLNRCESAPTRSC